MTTAVKKTTREAEAVGKLIEQFKGQAKIEAVIKAFAQQSQSLESTAFQVLEETDLTTAIGEQLDGLGQVLKVERGGRTDTVYRVRLLAEVIRNKSSGTIEEMIALAIALGITDIDLTEKYPAKIELVSELQFSNGLNAGRTVSSIRGGGIGYTWTWHESTNPFRFDTAGQGLDEGELAEMIDA